MSTCSFQVQYKMKQSVDEHTEDDKNMEAHVRKWQELIRDDLVHQEQGQAFTDIVYKSYANGIQEEVAMAEIGTYFHIHAHILKTELRDQSLRNFPFMQHQ
jgi:hypothetical protein